MRYLVRHESSYRYTQPVVTSFHRLHLTPWHGHGQQLLSHHITVGHPDGDGRHADLAGPSIVEETLDLFGNRCARVELLRPYDHLTITGWSQVQVDRQPATGSTAAWDAPATGPHPAIDEFRWNSLHVRRHAALAAYARPHFPPGRPLLDATRSLTEAIFADCAYDPQATDIATAPLTILETRRGVCQDFAHLGIACLRSLGLPAAYVSGYLETAPPAGQARLIGADASHAWFMVNDPQLGWLHFDPTNGCAVGGRHVVTAIGRDFSDVSPVIGIAYGGGTQTLEVAVDVVPETEWADSPLLARWPTTVQPIA